MDRSCYELLDFGSGRKLELFGNVVLDRPSPAAEWCIRARPELWAEAHARYERLSGDQGKWQIHRDLPQSWNFRRDELALELKLTEFGHVGLFPEQAENWTWIAEQVRAAAGPLNVLNLFAYTGASTLAAAAAGAAVVHIDAARSSVAWARRNALLSGLAERPIRWITEDARTFVAREVKRGNRYQGLILDPPTYGHGPRGQAWKLDEHLPELLANCRELLGGGGRQFVLLTCHAPGIGPRELREMLSAGISWPAQAIECGELRLPTADGRELPSGVYARAARGA